jgi:hypothetical protein
MNEAHREPIEDLAKRRRGYLAEVGTATAATAVAAIGSVIAFVSSLAIPFSWSLRLFSHPRPPEEAYGLEINPATVTALVIIGAITVICCRLCLGSAKSADTVVHVPPVQQQIAALHPDEVLVRGSSGPAVAPRELLRAARTGVESQTDELLRPDAVNAKVVDFDANRQQTL